MRVPIRKGGKYTYIKADPYMTQEKFDDLKKNLQRLKKDVQPGLAKEVKRLALMGDFSENAAYQIAKGSLRSINHRMEEITKQINGAIIIKTNHSSHIVLIGSLVTIALNKKIIKYHILGSSETNPSAGTISYLSPLGQSLLNKSIGDIAKLKIDDKTIEYKILKIN